MNKDNTIERVFKPLCGNPCWNVKWGWGSFLTLEFGEPYLLIDEPEDPRLGWSPARNKRYARRRIHVEGEWHLWIYCCEWKLYTGNKLVGDSAPESSSKRRIARGARELDGQKLLRVEVDPSRGSSVFTFDLGSRLETTPYDTDSDQWLLYEPSGDVFSYRADGMYSHQPGNTPPGSQQHHAFILDWYGSGNRGKLLW